MMRSESKQPGKNHMRTVILRNLVQRSLILLLAFSIGIACSQPALRGIHDGLPKARSPESVFEDVRQNQSRLSYLYKTWKFKQAQGIGGRTYGLVLTINASGDVEKVIVKGPTNKAFIAEIKANVRTWTFSKVEDKHPFVASLRNLDFSYRRELVVE